MYYSLEQKLITQDFQQADWFKLSWHPLTRQNRLRSSEDENAAHKDDAPPPNRAAPTPKKHSDATRNAAEATQLSTIAVHAH